MTDGTPTRSGDAAEERWAAYVAGLRQGPMPPFADQWATFQETWGDQMPEDGPPVAWRPTAKNVARSNIGKLMADVGVTGYPELHAWSVNFKPAFWEWLLRRLEVVFTRPPVGILDVSSGAADPVWLPGAELNCADTCFLADAARPAIVSGREGTDEIETTTYGELERLVGRFANGLRAHGFGPGDGIALYMPMTVECVAAYLGVVRAGCYVVSVADSFSPPELARRLEIGEAKGVVTVASYLRGGRTIDLYEKVRLADAPPAVVVAGAGGDLPELRPNDVAWDRFLADDADCPAVTGDPYRTTNVLFSSGTTGTPKAIPWNHLTPLKCAMDGYFHQDIHAGEVVAWPTNIGWMMGPWLIYASLMNRATMALYEGLPTGKGFIRFVREAGVAVLGVVPSLVRAWRDGGCLDEPLWPAVRLFSSTGEPSNREDYLWLMSRTGYRAPVIEYLGGTEIGGGHITGTVVQPASPATFTTPALGIDFLILDEAGQPVGEGEMGELFLLPPSLGLSQSLLNRDHHEVYYTGCPAGPNGAVLRRHGDEMARLHRGFFSARGRADDTMNLGGIKVSSVELERVMDDHPAVYESAAVAVQPGGEGAERLVAFVVPRGDIDAGRLGKELQALLGQRLNPLFRLHDLVLTDNLPRTASNKLMRRKLRATWLDRRS